MERGGEHGELVGVRETLPVERIVGQCCMLGGGDGRSARCQKRAHAVVAVVSHRIRRGAPPLHDLRGFT